MVLHLSPYAINHLHDAKCVKDLGNGSFGNVKLYKCKQEHEKCKSKCNKLFVVKQLFDKNNDNDKKLKKTLLNEYTIGTLLHHPCIRETLDVDFNKMSLIFEYCPGVNFYNYLKTRIDTTDDLCYFKEFVKGVSYMHNIGIAHMDLKLENIMIDIINKKLKIIDFGESKVFHDSLHLNTFILEKGIYGTLPYIAPEEFTQEQYNPEKVDVWSVTIILYEVLYNKLPWQQANFNNQQYKSYYNYFKVNKGLLPNLFKSVNNELFIELFTSGLNPDPNIRCNIDYIKNKLSI